MNRASRLPFLITLLVVLAACGPLGAANDPGDVAVLASPTATERQPTPLPTTVEPAPTFTAEPILEPTVAATSAEATSEAASSAVTLEATATTPPTEPVPPTEVPSATPTEPVPPTEVPSATPTEPVPTPSPPLSTNDVQRISPAEAKALIDSGEAVLYDARSAAAYNTAHAAGALLFSEADAAAHFAELPADKSLVFY